MGPPGTIDYFTCYNYNFQDINLGPIEWFNHVINWFLLKLGHLTRMQGTWSREKQIGSWV